MDKGLCAFLKKDGSQKRLFTIGYHPHLLQDTELFLEKITIGYHDTNRHLTLMIIVITITGWWFGTFFIFPYIGNVIIPIDELIFFRGVAQPPTSNNNNNKRNNKPSQNHHVCWVVKIFHPKLVAFSFWKHWWHVSRFFGLSLASPSF